MYVCYHQKYMHRNNYFITAFLYFVMLKFYFQMVISPAHHFVILFHKRPKSASMQWFKLSPFI